MWQIILFYSLYSINVKINIGNHFIRLFYKHCLCDQIYQRLINRNSIKLTCVAWIVLCLVWIMSSKNIILSFWKISYYLSAKLVIAVIIACLSKTITKKSFANTTVNKCYCGTCKNMFPKHYSNHLCPFRNRAINYLRIYGN